MHVDADRLRGLLDLRDISQSELARRVGISQSAIHKLVSGHGQGSKYIHRIAEELGTTPGYLTRDSNVLEPPEGTVAYQNHLKFIAAENTASVSRGLRGDKRQFRGAADEDTVKVAEINPRFGLGGAFMDEHAVPEMRTFSRAWLRQITKSPPDQLYWARGRGDSMEPAISDGDVCLIDRTETSPERFGDTYWAIAYGQAGMIKRLRPMPDGSVKILSNNPHVPPETAYEGELHVFGRVVAVVKKV